ncbi:MAG: FecR domain-containing protein [Chitinispirillia bacterium]|nr:FecR domain-containing protein [Chitinispirillia bacterium]MCL2241687.1 FecR domain-containing protein [Chitinispirillia bacterium]
MPVICRNFVNIALILAVLCAVPSFAGEEIEDRFCTVRGVVGSVQVRIDANYKKVRREMAVSRPVTAGVPSADISASITEEWTPLRLNMVVGERCEIRTGPESEVRLETAEGSMVKIGENTSVEVAALNAVKKAARGKQEVTANARFKISAGSIVATIKKALSGESPNVRFETPTSTAAIRGTTIEIEAQGDAKTVIRVFDGTVEVAPAGSDKFVPLSHGKMAEIGSGQRVVIAKDVPKAYKRKAVYVKGEVPPSEGSKGPPAAPDKTVQLAAAGTGSKKAVEENAAVAREEVKTVAVAAMDSVSISLGLSLGGDADTIQCPVGSTITVEGVVSPKNAVVSVNGVHAKPDATGIFKRTWAAPKEPGIFTLTVSAESGGQVKAITRTIRVTEKK